MNIEYEKGRKEGYFEGYKDGLRDAVANNPVYPVYPSQPYPPNDIIKRTICPMCGLDLSKPMSYVCTQYTQYNCPTFPRFT